MKKYIALSRGVNAGGKNKPPIPLLKSCLGLDIAVADPQMTFRKPIPYELTRETIMFRVRKQMMK